MKHFLKRLVGFSYGPALGAILSMAMTMILARVMLDGAYSKSNVFRELLINIPLFLYLGLDQAYTREYHQSPNKRELMQQAALLPMGIGIILFVVSIVFARSISAWLFDSPNYPEIVWLGGVWVLATVIERFLLLGIRMDEKAREFSNYTLLLKVNVFVLSLILVFLGVRDFRSAVYGLLVGQLLGDAVLFYNYLHFFDVREFKLDGPLIRQMLHFGIPVMLAVSLTSILGLISNLFMKELGTDKTKDVYNLTMTIVSVIGILKTSFSSFWVPTAYRWYEEQKSMKHYKFISDAVLLVLTIVFFGLLLFKWVFVWILGTRYQETLYIVGLLSFPHIMYTLSETTTLGIVFSRRTYFNILVSLLSLVPCILFNIWLTPTLSYKGAAIATCAAYITFYLARTFFSKQSGFYFSQKKALLSIALMTLAAGLNAFDVPHITWLTFGLGLLTVGIQYSTVQDALSIKRNGQAWDFS